MRRLALVCVMLMLPAAASAQTADSVEIGSDGLIPAPLPAASASSLNWMAGDWETGNVTDGITREHWEPMRGGTMLGLSQTVCGRVARGFEFMRIVRHAEGLVFYGSPEGGAAVAFGLASLIERPSEGVFEVVFVNPAHDFPKRISYRLAGETGNMLVATISGADSKVDGMTWQFRRISPTAP